MLIHALTKRVKGLQAIVRIIFYLQENLKRHLDRIPSHADGGGDSSQDSSDEDAANGTGGPKQSESYLLESVFASYEGVQNQRTSEAIVQSVTGKR